MKSFKQKLHVLAVGAAFVTAAMLPAVAQAGLSWQYDNADAVAADSPGYVPPGGFGAPGQMGLLSPLMNSLTFTTESIIVWHGTPFAPGSTFSDFVVARVNDYRFNNAPVTEASYGNGIAGLIAGDHQITMIIKATGKQDTTNTYHLTPGAFTLNWIWDSGDNATSAKPTRISTSISCQKRPTGHWWNIQRSCPAMAPTPRRGCLTVRSVS